MTKQGIQAFAGGIILATAVLATVFILQTKIRPAL